MQAYRMEKLFHAMRALNSSTDYEFSSVDRLFVSQRLPLQKCVADVFKDEVHKMDFVVDPELARLYINNWVANQTNEQIKDLIPSSMISYNTRLVLVNIGSISCFKQFVVIILRLVPIGECGIFQRPMEFQVFVREHERRSVLHVNHRKRIRSNDVAIWYFQPM